MFKEKVLLILVFFTTINYCHSSLPEDIIQTSAECLTHSLKTSLYCRGSRAINNIISHLSKTDKAIVIVRGLEIVPTNRHYNDTADNNKTNNGWDGMDDDTFLGRFAHYLRTHELNIKFADLMSAEEGEQFLARDSEQNGMQINLLDDESRKKDKGNSMIITLGLMLSKMMAVVGLGSIGALAMKALGVAMTALMMATMVGLKSMAYQTKESSQNIQYVTTADGHHNRRSRRRRSLLHNSNISSTQLFATKNM